VGVADPRLTVASRPRPSAALAGAAGAELTGRRQPRPAHEEAIRVTTRRWFLRAGNRVGVWLYRTLDGRLASGRRDVTVLLLTVPGRRTGRPRPVCVRYLDTDDGFVVWGTGSGSPTDPDWFRNLRAADRARVQVRERVLVATPRELLGEERDRAWHDVVLARAPEVERYATRAGRVIPVALLVPDRSG
jgi:deazaflavin-dependent oxidoreductase (nitroreductase family)